MARMPQAEWLGERSPRNAMSRYDVVCVHTIVGYAPAHAAHFSVHQGGTIQQSRDTRYRSAANLNGNHRVISIENEDHGSAFPSWSGSNVPALTDAQVEANAQILAWAHKTHGVPLKLCPNSRPTSRGLAYHRQGIDGNFGPFKYGGRVSGGEVWSSSFGKVCPGDRRIDQLPAILARAKQIAGGDSMSWNDDLTPGTPGNDITKLSDDTMPPGWGRHAADLLGYAAAHWAWARNTDGMVQRVWRTDGVLRSPSTRPDRDTNPHLYAETFLREIWDMCHALRTVPDELEALRTGILGGSADEIKALIEAKHAEAAAQRQTIADTMTDRLDAIAAVLSEHADGSLDAEQVVRRIGELLTTDA